MEYRSFYVDLEYSEFDKLKDIIKQPKRGIEKFLICFEEFNKEGLRKPHFHVLLYVTKQTFETLLSYIVSKNAFNLTEKQKLKNKQLGHKGSGGYRMFGRAKKGEALHTIEKFITYLHKDDRVYAEGIDKEMLSIAHSNSFENPKLLQKKAKQTLLDYLDETIKNNCPMDYEDIWDPKDCKNYRYNVYDKDAIIKLIIYYILENPIGLSLSPSAVTGYYNNYLMTKTSLSLDERYELCIAKNKY